MATREVDPYDPEQVWRRLLAVVEWRGTSERAFASSCDVNYNQWNNYKSKKMLPGARMLEKIARKTGIDYMFLRFGKEHVLTLEQAGILDIMKRNQ